MRRPSLSTQADVKVRMAACAPIWADEGYSVLHDVPLSPRMIRLHQPMGFLYCGLDQPALGNAKKLAGDSPTKIFRKFHHPSANEFLVDWIRS